MNRIKEPIELAGKICGSQKPKTDSSYRWIKHCIKAQCEKGILVYHTLTGMLALLPTGEITENDNITLMNNWFLVPETFDECKYADQVYRISQTLIPSGKEKTSFTILTTTDCNARCFYCYEMGIKRIPMTTETALDVAAYIIRVSGEKAVKLRWFGGEPLYNREAIDVICNTLKENKKEYDSRMISNGYYLDRETAKHAVQDWNLKRVQITIDGPEAVYNRTKAYIDADANPYKRVMENIQAALDAGIEVSIRLNMDAANAGSLLTLADEFAERFANTPKPEVYAALLHAYAGKIHQHDSMEAAEQDYFALYDRLDGYGFAANSKELPSSLRTGCCMADNDAAEVILPDGRVGRCEHVGESMITGHIHSDERDKNVTKQWKEPLSVPECRDCALYPQCTKLRLCEGNRDGCSELERKIQIEEIKRAMLETYRKHQEGGKI